MGYETKITVTDCSVGLKVEDADEGKGYALEFRMSEQANMCLVAVRIDGEERSVLMDLGHIGGFARCLTEVVRVYERYHMAGALGEPRKKVGARGKPQKKIGA